MNDLVFVPSRGFLFFYCGKGTFQYEVGSFRPLTGISLFLFLGETNIDIVKFSSPHGDFSFSIENSSIHNYRRRVFSSPHGDFSFSMVDTKTIVKSNGFSSPHGDFSFSIKRC